MVISGSTSRLIFDLVRLLVFRLILSLGTGVLMSEAFVVFLFQLRVCGGISGPTVPEGKSTRICQGLNVTEFFGAPCLYAQGQRETQ